MSEQAVLEGFISVRAALKAGSRPIQAIYLRHDRRDRGIAWLEHAAAAAGIPVRRVTADEIDARAGGMKPTTPGCVFLNSTATTPG